MCLSDKEHTFIVRLVAELMLHLHTVVTILHFQHSDVHMDGNRGNFKICLFGRDVTE